MAAFTISTVARDAGVNVETIRFYQRQGLLLQPKKPLGGIRRYSDDDVMRVRFIKSAQRLGFKLEEVALLLKLDDGTHCREAKGIAERKLSEIQDRITDLRRMETLLSGLVKRCAASRGQVTCPLISSLRGTV